MEIYVLTGPSGTGKSTSALSVAYQYNIPAMIDDGLLIYNGKRVAGTSAKFEKNTMKAVKRAIFHDEKHAKEVKDAIKKLNINKILLIGTSVNMVKKIAKKLELGEIDHYLTVEDVRTSSEISIALYTRRTEGKHVIPIPYVQVDQSFFKKIISKGKSFFSPQKEKIGETTIVQPNFQKGSIHISEGVLQKIIKLICKEIEIIDHVHSIDVKLTGEPYLIIEVTAKQFPNENIMNVLQKAQQKIFTDFNQYMNVELSSIHIKVKKLQMNESVNKEFKRSIASK
ncbi:ATP-binding protein [Bacillus alveayuensis]|jgi:adenylate kinase family enzyme/uncharacterized alkaline shock family protein YloU|uniref:ATP-binding protein n=1 Tax=Aeribacillus alveayuensis TaxID=279215 RepID=UPI0005CCC9D6|nr:ATP-binding protein [Bacillus alveayuensis]